MKKQRFKVGRTREGMLFEGAFVVLALLVWAFALLLLHHTPDMAPTHLELSGQPDQYQSKWHLLVSCIILSLAALSCLVLAYFPHLANLPVSVNNSRQAALVVRMSRTLAIGLLLFVPALALRLTTGTPIPVWVVAGLIVLILMVFTWLVHRAR